MSQNKLLFCSLNSNLRIMYLQLSLQDLVLSWRTPFKQHLNFWKLNEKSKA